MSKAKNYNKSRGRAPKFTKRRPIAEKLSSKLKVSDLIHPLTPPESSGGSRGIIQIAKSNTKKRVKFNNIVQIFRIDDNWRLTEFRARLKTEAEQQKRNQQIQDFYRQSLLRYRSELRGLWAKM